eukprot:CFRG0917T1
MMEFWQFQSIAVSYLCMILVWLSGLYEGWITLVLRTSAVVLAPTFFLILDSSSNDSKSNATPMQHPYVQIPVLNTPNNHKQLSGTSLSPSIYKSANTNRLRKTPLSASFNDVGAKHPLKHARYTRSTAGYSNGGVPNGPQTQRDSTASASELSHSVDTILHRVVPDPGLNEDTLIDNTKFDLKLRPPSGAYPKSQAILPLKVLNVANSEFDASRAQEITINPRAPVEFENDVFKGRCIIKVRTNPEDPYYTPYFEGKKRTFEFQIQGKFKEAMRPDERLMFGVETNDPVHFGLVGRGVCRVMLAVCNRIVPGNHWGFGSSKTKEKPHITFPIESSIDRLIITPQDEEPPLLGVDSLPEPISKKERNAMQLICDDTNTYTFSFHGMYVDFIKWKGVNFPGMRDVDITSLVGKIPLRMVGYTIPRHHDGPHTMDLKKYCFCFEMQHSGEDLMILPDDSVSVQSSTYSSSYVERIVQREVPRAVMEQRILEMTKRASIMELDERPMLGITVDCNMYLLGSSANHGIWFVLKVTNKNGTSWAVLRPAESFRELEDLHHRMNSDESGNNVEDAQSFGKISRLSSTDDLEQHCHAITAFLRELLGLPNGYRSVRAFLDQDFTLNCGLLTGNKKDLDISISYTSGSVSIEGPVARAMWAERWVECWAVLYSTHMSFYHSGKRTADFTIPLAEVVLVRNMDSYPFEGAFLEIHTLGIVYYIAYCTAENCEEWSNKIQAQSSAVQAATFSQGSVQLNQNQSIIESFSASAKANLASVPFPLHASSTHSSASKTTRIKNSAKRLSNSAGAKVLFPVKSLANRSREKIGGISDGALPGSANSADPSPGHSPTVTARTSPTSSPITTAPQSPPGTITSRNTRSQSTSVGKDSYPNTDQSSCHRSANLNVVSAEKNIARYRSDTMANTSDNEKDKDRNGLAYLGLPATVTADTPAHSLTDEPVAICDPRNRRRNNRKRSLSAQEISTHNYTVHGQCMSSSIPTKEDEKTSESALVLISAQMPNNPADMFLVRSKSRWKSSRIILNNRRTYFETPHTLPHPCATVSTALLLVLRLNQNSSRNMITSYLDSVSALKLISITQLAALDLHERKSFFLNLYHCIVAHYLFVMGSPTNTRRGFALFHVECSMQVGKNVFSLSEIENGIFRAAMATPRKSNRYSPSKTISGELRQILGARYPDPRIQMAINWGIETCGHSVYNYSDDPDILDTQLNMASAAFINRNVVVDTAKKTITIDKLFDCYMSDFGSNKLEMIDTLLKYADQAKEQEILSLRRSLREKDIKFKKNDNKWINSLNLREAIVC